VSQTDFRSGILIVLPQIVVQFFNDIPFLPW
jgi:hypothetical protein